MKLFGTKFEDWWAEDFLQTGVISLAFIHKRNF